MKFKVEFTEQAELEADLAYEWISKDSPANAVSWFNGLVDAQKLSQILSDSAGQERTVVKWLL